MVTVRLRWLETQDEAFILVFHDLMVFAFKFGGNRRFLGWIQQILCCAGMVRGPSQFGWGNLKPGWRTAPKSLNAAAIDNYNNFFEDN